MSLRLSAVAAALPFVFSQSSVFAITLDPVIVSATRVEQQLSDVLPSATVITREEIERANAPTLIDLLQGKPGVEIGRNGGPGTQSSIFMRGQESKNVAVFIDGVRVETDLMGNLTRIDLPTNQIERVEILRGNMSALYGESATGGVIHIYTRAGAGYSGGNASLTYGSRNTVDASAGYQVNQDGWKAGFSVNRFDTDGYSARNVKQAPLANPDKDGYERNALFLNLERSVNPDLAFGIKANAIDSKSEYDNASGLPVDLHYNKTKTNDITFYSKFKLNEDWSSRFGLTQSNLSSGEYENTGAGFKNTNRSKGDQLSMEWSNTYQLGNGNGTLGVEMADAKFKSGNPVASLINYKRRSNAFYIGYSGRAGVLDYQANVRHDSITAKSPTSTIKNGKSTWLLAAGYHLTDDLKIMGMQSTSFRAPSSGELFITEWGGNPNLKPEEHKGREVGLQYLSGVGLLRAVLFESKTTNAIAVWPIENIDQTKNSGIEISIAGSANNTVYKASYVSQDPRNTDKNTRLIRRAKEYASFDLTTKFSDIEWAANIIWSGNRADSGNRTLSSYTVVNLTAIKNLTPNWSGRVKVENAFNEKYQLVHSFDAVSRGIFFTLDYRPR